MGILYKFAGIAQLVEQFTCNEWAVGSIPAAGTSFRLEQ